MDDEFLVRQVLAGNRQAFRLLVLRYQRPLFRFLGLLGLESSTAEDVAQDTFLRAFGALASFEPTRGTFSTWLFTIAKRLAVNEWRKGHRRYETSAVDERELPSESSDPSERALNADRALRVQRALATLPAALRSTFLHSQIERMPLEEVAKIEGCAVGTVKSRIHRVREYLRLSLAKEEI